MSRYLVIEKKIVKAVDKTTDVIMAVFFILCLLIGFYIAYDSYYVYSKASVDRLNVYRPMVMEDNSIDTTSLKSLSKDVVGWITIDETSIDYPVLQGLTNMDYINTDPFGDFSLAGSIFLDSGNSKDFSDSYNMIYGHHMEHGYMFGSLDEFKSATYCNEHQTGKIVTTDGEVIRIKLYAVVKGVTTDNIIFDVNVGNKDVEQLVEHIKDNNMYININDTNNKRVFALSTCADSISQERLIVFFVEDI